MLSREELIKKVAQRTDLKPATVSQYLWAQGFQPSERKIRGSQVLYLYVKSKIAEAVKLIKSRHLVNLKGGESVGSKKVRKKSK